MQDNAIEKLNNIVIKQYCFEIVLTSQTPQKGDRDPKALDDPWRTMSI